LLQITPRFVFFVGLPPRLANFAYLSIRRDGTRVSRDQAQAGVDRQRNVFGLEPDGQWARICHVVGFGHIIQQLTSMTRSMSCTPAPNEYECWPRSIMQQTCENRRLGVRPPIHHAAKRGPPQTELVNCVSSGCSSRIKWTRLQHTLEPTRSKYRGRVSSGPGNAHGEPGRKVV